MSVNKIGGAIYWVDNPSGTVGYFAHIVPFVFGRIFFSNELVIRKFSLKSNRHSASAGWVKVALQLWESYGREISRRNGNVLGTLGLSMLGEKV